MTRPVRARRSFRDDVVSQVSDLRRRGDSESIDGLRAAIREARTFLSRFPAAGTSFHAEERVSLRRLILRRVPFVIWYVDDGTTLWLLRFFHARQNRKLRTP